MTGLPWINTAPCRFLVLWQDHGAETFEVERYSLLASAQSRYDDLQRAGAYVMLTAILDGIYPERGNGKLPASL